MNASTRFLLLLTILLLAACGGRSDGTGPNEDTAGGEDASVDIWWDDVDAGAGEDTLSDVEPGPDTLEDTAPMDVLEDSEPLEDSLEDLLEDSLEDVLEDLPEDNVDVMDSWEDGGDTEEDVVEPPIGPVLEVTQCGDLPALAEGDCVVEEGSPVLVIRGDVLAPWEVFEGGEILISSGGDIGCVGCDCSDHPEYAAATVITCPDGIVSPGLINSDKLLTKLLVEIISPLYSYRSTHSSIMWRMGQNTEIIKEATL